MLRAIFWCWLYMLCSMSSHAQKFDQDYLNWKAQQEAQDRRLMHRADPNYYLAKPASSTTKTALGNKISLNHADISQLQQLHGVGEKKAQAIIEYRQQQGGFKRIEDLQKVKGIGPKLFERNRDRLGL